MLMTMPMNQGAAGAPGMTKTQSINGNADELMAD